MIGRSFIRVGITMMAVLVALVEVKPLPASAADQVTPPCSSLNSIGLGRSFFPPTYVDGLVYPASVFVLAGPIPPGSAIPPASPVTTCRAPWAPTASLTSSPATVNVGQAVTVRGAGFPGWRSQLGMRVPTNLLTTANGLNTPVVIGLPGPNRIPLHLQTTVPGTINGQQLWEPLVGQKGAWRGDGYLYVTVSTSGDWSFTFSPDEFAPPGSPNHYPSPPGYNGIQVSVITPPRAPLSKSSSSSHPADRAAVSSLITPARAFGSTKTNIINAALASAAVLVLVFPSELFNRTLEENYAFVTGPWRRWWRRLAKREGAGDESSDPSHDPGLPVASLPDGVPTVTTAIPVDPPFARLSLVAVVVALGALLNSLLASTNVWSRQFLDHWVSATLAIVIMFIFPALLVAAYRASSGQGARFGVSIYPFGLAVTVLCVSISRLTNFQPGYFYGFVLAALFVGEQRTRQRALSALVSIEGVALLGIVSWVAWSSWFTPGHHAGKSLVAELLKNLTVEASLAAVIAGLPLHYFPGRKLLRWNPWVWGAVEMTNLFLLFSVVVNPHGADNAQSSWVTAILLFGIFGGTSVTFYWYCRIRNPEFRSKMNQSATPALKDAVEP